MHIPEDERAAESSIATTKVSHTATAESRHGSNNRVVSLEGPLSFVTAPDSLRRLVVGRYSEVRESRLRRSAVIEQLPNLGVILGPSADPLGEFLSVGLRVGADADALGTFPDHPPTDLAFDLHGRASIGAAIVVASVNIPGPPCRLLGSRREALPTGIVGRSRIAMTAFVSG